MKKIDSQYSLNTFSDGRNNTAQLQSIYDLNQANTPEVGSLESVNHLKRLIELSSYNLLVLNDISFSSMKTKLLKESLNKLPLGKSALFVAGEEIDQNFNKALSNIPMHDIVPIQGANVYDILKRETLVLCKNSVEALVNRLTVSKVKTKIVKEKK